VTSSTARFEGMACRKRRGRSPRVLGGRAEGSATVMVWLLPHEALLARGFSPLSIVLFLVEGPGYEALFRENPVFCKHRDCRGTALIILQKISKTNIQE